MHFSASTALGLGLLAAHATAIVVPVKKDVGLSLPVTVTVTDTPLPVTVTITTPVTVTATVSISVTAGNSTTNSTTISSTSSVTSTTSITTTTVLPIAVSTAVSATLAVPTTPQTPSTPSTDGLTADQKRALELHNIYRAEVGNPPLTWDAELAESAQAWANHLTTVGSLVHDENPGGQGENLALQSGGTDTYYANGVQLWLDEKSLYDGQPIRSDGSPNYMDYGHYTQAIWKSTTKVGLALATDAKGTAYVVARYLPPGNFIGQMPY